MSSVFVSSPAEVVVIDSRTRAGTITLPTTNSIPYRTINFKDQYGSFSNSTLTLSTQTGDIFDDGTTTKVFSNAFTYLSLYATPSRWMIMNATQTVQQTISSLTVNQLTFGTGAGWVQFGPVQASIVSSIQVNTNDAYINNVYVGNQSTLNDIMYWGLFGNYNNTVLAEISTGAGTQELLVFRGSSSSDRVRVQTTGTFVVETGVSSRLFNSNTTATLSNATPAFIINTSSNVGIQTATPATTLDVAGTIRGQLVSTLGLNVSSLNGGTILTPAQLISTTFGLVETSELTSTVVGLGSAGYVSSASLLNLVSTTFLNTTLASSITGLGSAGYISTSQLISTTQGLVEVPELTSSVIGLGSAGYISTLQLISTTTGLQQSGFVSSPNLLNLVSTQGLSTVLYSTINSLGSFGYISTSQLISTTQGLVEVPELTSTVVGLGSVGYISTLQLISTTLGLQTSGFVSSPNLLNLVSTQGLSTVLYSTINSLASFGYISTSQLISTVAGLGTGGYPSTVSTAYGTNFVTSNLTASTMSFVNVNPSTMNMWVAVGGDSSNAIKYSYNGIDWFNSVSGSVTTGFGVAWNGQLWVAAGIDGVQGTLKYSYDGMNWSNAASGAFASSGTGVAWNGRLWVAVGDTLVGSRIKYSYDGSNWSNSTGSAFDLAGLGVAWNGKIWVAGGQDSVPNNTLKYSLNGINWSNSLSGGFSDFCYSVAWNGRLWVATGNDAVNTNKLKYSFDGLNWSNSTGNGFTGQGFDVAWNGTFWVAVGVDSTSNNTIKYSFDGSNWSNSSSGGFTTSGRGISWNGEIWVAVGAAGTVNELIKYSRDGLNWSNSSGISFSSRGNKVAFSSNVIPAYQQSNLQILPQNIPLYFTSTNTILAQTSSLVINNTIDIDANFNRVGINCNVPQVDLDVGGVVRGTTVSTQALNFSSLNGQLFGAPIFSTVIGLGSAGYISTSQLVSTVAGLATGGGSASPPFLSAFTVSTGSVSASTLQAFTLSTGSLTVSTLRSFTENIGNQSTVNSIQYFGLFGNFNNTALAEVSTGVGLQELLIFKGSSASDRVRVQTTGNFVVETGVSARLWSTTGLATPSNITPAFLINSSSNVGIQTATPATALDVAGTTRALTLSSLNLNVSSVTGASFVVATSEAVRFNGTNAASLYGLGQDTLTVQSLCNSYSGGIASIGFANNTASYPLARIYGIDSASSGPAISQLVFQTVPASSTSFNSNFTYTGSDQTFTVPTGVTTISVKLWGAGGGGDTGRGGAGAFISGTLTVTPGQVLTIITGQGGLNSTAGGSVAMYGGGGRGNGGFTNTNASAGGGRSAIQLNLNNIISSASGSGTVITYNTNTSHGLAANQPVIISGLSPSGFNGIFLVTSTPTSTQFTVAGAQTGSSSGTGSIKAELVTVGAGGGSADVAPNLQGGNGTFSGTAASGTAGGTVTPATGGTQSAGGTAAVGPGGFQAGSAGSLLTGGGAGYRGGGGGGGYYGGGGGGSDNGGSNYASGAGGSSYTSFSGFTLVVGSNSSDGYSAPGSGDSSYIAGVAVGGALTGGAGGSGLVVLASVGNALSEAMRIGSNGFLGIGTTTPQTNIDVAGTGRFQNLSTLNINLSSINGQVFGQPINSTVIGLGSAGYISTSQLVSTTVGLVDVPELTSSLVGLGSFGYISTSQLTSTVAGLGTGGLTTLPSTISSFSLLTSSLFVSTTTTNILSSQQVLASSVTAPILSSLAIFASSIIAPYIFAAQYFTF